MGAAETCVASRNGDVLKQDGEATMEGAVQGGTEQEACNYSTEEKHDEKEEEEDEEEEEEDAEEGDDEEDDEAEDEAPSPEHEHDRGPGLCLVLTLDCSNRRPNIITGLDPDRDVSRLPRIILVMRIVRISLYSDEQDLERHLGLTMTPILTPTLI